jgi:seryl-tRNA synthetase
MLEIQKIVKDPFIFINGLKKRDLNLEKEILSLVDLEKNRKELQIEFDNLSLLLNKNSENIFLMMKNQKNENEIEVEKKNASNLRSKILEKKEKLNEISKKIKEILQSIPNIPSESTPYGKNSTENVVIFEKYFDKSKKKLPHWDIIKKFDLIDFPLGAKISGSGFPFFKKKGAKLQRSLINFLLDQALEQGYTEIIPPLVVNRESTFGTGQLPDMEGQMYEIINENLFLISTSEIPLTNIFRDEILEEKDLPIKFAAYTPCFRRESGSWGADVRALNRLHQFDKVELVEFVSPKSSYKRIQEILEFLKSVLDKLKISYRVLNLCSGDMGSKATFQYDIEVWSPGQEKWLEVSTLSNFETFQSNRMNIKFKNQEKKNELVHTINGSCFGISRLLASILESYQEENFIKIPEVLISYTGFFEIS